ncbi:hypothetical protein MB02_09715 [Croceicoccus estronivorus]|uniref:OmpA family protein n=1 Tax=Croceicoccus estronivorus TaxID=1172626 RepID=UPI0008295302|nr:OmpA family protein [Croceicoccus estronivorus]OCC24065.1 hypothetical protein MB02_09715 [Croceicoccus estronivorus]
MMQSRKSNAMKYIATAFAVCLAGATLSGCDNGPQTPQPDDTATEDQPGSPPPVDKMPADSIIRSDIEAPAAVDEALQPLSVIIGFADGGAELDAAGREQIDRLMESEQFMRGWPIVLRGHTDSTGDDRANLRASRHRAEVVEAYLVDHGVAEDRLTIIAMGEQRPIAPNAKRDGTPDQAGRARNRRVEITLEPADHPAGPVKNGETVADDKDAS